VLVTAAGADAEATQRQAHENAKRHLAETDRPERIIVVADSDDFRRRYFTITGWPRRQELFDDLVAAAPA
jgi:hypothetical protein